jgi:hypothetical protein
VVATYANAQRARARAVNVKGLKKNLREVLSGAQMSAVEATKGVLHAGILCFLEGFNIRVGLGPIRLTAVSTHGRVPRTQEWTHVVP